MVAGRPEKPISLKQVEKLASIGLNEQQIADSLGIHGDTMRRRKKKYTEFCEALSRGQAKGIEKVVSALFNTAVEGSVPAQSLFLKNRAGWSDKQEITGADGKDLIPDGFTINHVTADS